MKNLFNKYRLTGICNTIALAACITAGSSTMKAQTYGLTDLGVLPGKETEATSPAALNEQGQVAGNSGESAFRYEGMDKKAMEDLARSLPRSVSRAFGINAFGQVVGDATLTGAPVPGTKTARHAVIFKEGSVTDLGVLKRGGAYSRANGVNRAGQVVGFSGPALDSASSRAFIWSSSTGMLDLGTLGGAYAQALGINDAGMVTGNAQKGSVAVGVDQPAASHAFLWSAKMGMLDLGTLAGEFSYGTFINARNHVVGYSTIDKENDRVHAFLFNGEKMQDLGSLSAGSAASDRSFALGVNDNDEVVGHTYLPDSGPGMGAGAIYAPRQVAFVYRNGTMVDLNNLIGDEAKNYQLYSATAINNNGQIAALALDLRANVFRAVLLTPRKANDGLVVTEATYWADYHALVVQANVPPQSPTGAAPALDVFNVDGKKIGSLDRSANGSYAAKLFSPTNPKEIVVTSSHGGNARATVKESGSALTPSKP